MSAAQPKDDRQPIWFLGLFALAVGGGAIAYMPLLTVLLPLKITEMMNGQDVAALARVTFFGALLASLANIAFGMLSDRSGTRTPWIIAGLISSSILLVAIGYARNLTELIVLVMLWQIGLNMMLGPLLAWAGDCFPDSQKGLLGGALSLAPALGAGAGSFVTFESVIGADQRLWVVVVLVALCVLPAVVLGRGRVRPELMGFAGAENTDPVLTHDRATVIRMWIARFLVQIAEAGLFAFLLFWLQSISNGIHENFAANIFTLVILLSVPLSLWLGRWSDKAVRPILPLTICASVTAIGLVVMAMAGGLTLAIAGYVLFSVAASVFLSLHTGQTLRVLPQPRRRGRDLGIFNLTNTVPSIVMPWLTLTLVPGFGFSGLFALFASLAMVATVLLATISVRQRAVQACNTGNDL